MCTHAVCFRGVVEADEARRIRRHAEVCAGHVVDMITMLMSWASEHELDNAKVTVHAIPPERATGYDHDGDAAPLSPESVQVTTFPVLA